MAAPNHLTMTAMLSSRSPRLQKAAKNVACIHTQPAIAEQVVLTNPWPRGRWFAPNSDDLQLQGSESLHVDHVDRSVYGETNSEWGQIINGLHGSWIQNPYKSMKVYVFFMFFLWKLQHVATHPWQHPCFPHYSHPSKKLPTWARSLLATLEHHLVDQLSVFGWFCQICRSLSV